MGETLSPTFVGMSFQEVAEICYLRLNLLLVAIEARKYEGGNIWINPKDKVLSANCIGLFITNSSDAVKRAWFYCRVCHQNISKLEEIRKCSCKKLAKERYTYFQNGKDLKYEKSGIVGAFPMIDDDDPVEDKAVTKKGDSNKKDEDVGKMKYDSTGTYHWCQAR